MEITYHLVMTEISFLALEIRATQLTSKMTRREGFVLMKCSVVIEDLITLVTFRLLAIIRGVCHIGDFGLVVQLLVKMMRLVEGRRRYREKDTRSGMLFTR